MTDNGRVPPHDLPAEESLLGAIMLSSDAIRAAIDAHVTAADFYKPAWGDIYAAALALYDRDAPCDPVTIGAELNGQLDRVGGRKTLLELQAHTPASANAAHYANTIRTHAHRRQVIAAAAHVEQVTYAGVDPGPALEELAQLAAANTATARLAPHDLAAILDGHPPEIVPTIWARNDGTHLVYPGRVCSLQAEPSAGKSWLALAICAEQLALEQTAIYIDFEADPSTTIERLRALNATDDQIRNLLIYLRPDEPFTAADRAQLATLVTARAATVVVVDTLAAALATQGINEDSNPDVIAHLQATYRPLARAGAAVVLLDHVVKDKDTRGRWARGASSKLGELDAAYGITATQPFSRTHDGRIRVRLEKDRYGAIGTERATVADINVTVTNLGHTIRFDVAAPAGDSNDYAPTHAMRAVSEILEGLGGVPATKKQLEASIPMKADTVRRAIAELVRTAHIKIDTGPRGALHHKLITPYREPDETPETGPTDDEPF